MLDHTEGYQPAQDEEYYQARDKVYHQIKIALEETGKIPTHLHIHKNEELQSYMMLVCHQLGIKFDLVPIATYWEWVRPA
jgi:hypothetical protein